MKTETINSLALALFDIAESADDGGTTSNLAFDLAEKAGWRWRDDEQFCRWALGATEAECAREGKRRFLVSRLLALRLLPLNEEQTWILSDPSEREERALMLADLRDRCGLPLTDEEFAQLMR